MVEMFGWSMDGGRISDIGYQISEGEEKGDDNTEVTENGTQRTQGSQKR